MLVASMISSRGMMEKLIPALVAVNYFANVLCLASILRKQWVDNEKLTFPLVQLPLEFVEPPSVPPIRREAGKSGFFTNRLMWIGFGLVALVFTLNGLHGIYPVVPNFNLHQNLNRYFTERPFNAMFYTPVYLSFAAIEFFICFRHSFFSVYGSFSYSQEFRTSSL